MKCRTTPFSEGLSKISQPFINCHRRQSLRFPFSHYLKSNHSHIDQGATTRQCPYNITAESPVLYFRSIEHYSPVTSAGPTLVLPAQPLWPDCCELGDVRRTGDCYRSQDSTHCRHNIYRISTLYLHFYTISTKYLYTI